MRQQSLLVSGILFLYIPYNIYCGHSFHWRLLNRIFSHYLVFVVHITAPECFNLNNLESKIKSDAPQDCLRVCCPSSHLLPASWADAGPQVCPGGNKSILVSALQMNHNFHIQTISDFQHLPTCKFHRWDARFYTGRFLWADPSLPSTPVLLRKTLTSGLSLTQNLYYVQTR